MSDEDSFVILDTLSLDSKGDDNSSIDNLQQSLTTADGVGASSIKPKKISKSCLSGEFKNVSETQQRRNAERGDVEPQMAEARLVKDSKLWQRFRTSTESEIDSENSIKKGITSFAQHIPFMLTPDVSEESLLKTSKLSKQLGKDNNKQETSTFCKITTDNESPLQSWLTVSHPNVDIGNSSIARNKIPKDLEHRSIAEGIANESDSQQRNTAQKICTQSSIQPEVAEVISLRDSKLWQRTTISTTSEKDFDSSIKANKNSCAQNNSRILTPHSVQESLSNKSKMSNELEKQDTYEETSTSKNATSCVIESKQSNESPLQNWLTVDHSTTGKIIKESILISASAVNTAENVRKEKSLETSPSNSGSSGNSGPSSAVTDRSSNSNLAASFILGEINVDVLKTSVYSQFPSISMQASAEDIVKLQNLLTEHTQLQTTLTKFTNTLQQYHRSTLQFKEERQKNEKRYSEQLQECQKQIQQLQDENTRLNKDIGTQLDQIKALDIVRQKDREEMIQSISEKSALIENMRAQIEKLEQSQLASFDVLPASLLKTGKSSSDEIYIRREEHQKVVKNLETQLSELLAKNLDFKDMEKQYIDELNCLKVNLAAAEELIRQSRAEIHELKTSNLDKQHRIEDLNQRITLLEQSNQVHRHDFEIERQSREKAVGEKQQMLKDLRILQKRNQKLIEERQNQIDNYEKFLGNSMSSSSYNNPIQCLVPSPTDQAVALPIEKAPQSYRCPVCDKAFKTLMILHSHVNDCIDKN
ncbi:NF-kappa-B essential modulator kenny isoform 1-T8 [Glossina fuscipes fuscipes]